MSAKSKQSKAKMKLCAQCTHVAEQTAFVSGTVIHCPSKVLALHCLLPHCNTLQVFSLSFSSLYLPLSLSLSHKSHLRPCECANAPNRQINLVQKYLKVYLLSGCMCICVCVPCVCMCVVELNKEILTCKIAQNENERKKQAQRMRPKNRSPKLKTHM